MERLKGPDIRVEGELSYRILKNYSRLEDMFYHPENLFGEDGWPGDKVGRVYLSWILLWKAMGRKPAYLEELRDAIDRKMNGSGYFGEILPPGEADEQQLSGHNWFLRALLEEYLYTGDPVAAERAKRLVSQLYLPLKGMYRSYPIMPDGRNRSGKASGEIVGVNQDGWRLSSDIGCAFMSLDGLSQYYEIFREEEVWALLEEMLERFKTIDFVGLSMQTHASLSAMRGVVRLYCCRGEKPLLDFAEEFFRLYRDKGMTENYGNYNWFGKPYWTEPCAIVDSYLLAVMLFAQTRKKEYADCASRIWFNGLGHAQRSNGGFGCDNCAGAGEDWDSLSVRKAEYEAYWCCTMRGSEGLVRAAENAVLRGGEDIFILNYFPMEYQDKGISLKMTTRYPYEGEAALEAESASWSTFYFYFPEGTDRDKVRILRNGSLEELVWDGGFCRVAVSGKISLRISFPIEMTQCESRNHQGYLSLWHGDLMLGTVKGADDGGKRMLPAGTLRAVSLGKGCYRIGEWEAKPIDRTIYCEKETMLENKLQILYADQREWSDE